MNEGWATPTLPFPIPFIYSIIYASTDHLYKLRPFLTIVAERFEAVYHPHCQCAIDKAMAPYKGRSSLKQYMPQKPIKRGFKEWVRADNINGYDSQFQVYTRKETSSTENGLGSRVAKDLTATIHHCNHHLYCDNFSSFQLFSDLLSVGIYACGTIRSSRKHFPSELTPYLKCVFPERGDNMTLQSEIQPNFTVFVGQDTKPVTVTATNCQAIPLDSVTHKLKTGQHHTYSCPEAIKQYNKYMGGVDRNNQLRQYYQIHLKCRKYYKYLYWMLFDITISNTFILSATSESLSSITRSTKDFQSSLAKELLQGYVPGRQKGDI
uniref:PiggyBac transposable element-derived protein domain-containing protein n=1 Tax=Amphimedon queenslandica TaxID=400682 RepID=A0A1X7V7F8_AMPQE